MKEIALIVMPYAAEVGFEVTRLTVKASSLSLQGGVQQDYDACSHELVGWAAVKETKTRRLSLMHCGLLFQHYVHTTTACLIS